MAKRIRKVSKRRTLKRGFKRKTFKRKNIRRRKKKQGGTLKVDVGALGEVQAQGEVTTLESLKELLEGPSGYGGAICLFGQKAKDFDSNLNSAARWTFKDAQPLPPYYDVKGYSVNIYRVLMPPYAPAQVGDEVVYSGCLVEGRSVKGKSARFLRMGFKSRFPYTIFNFGEGPFKNRLKYREKPIMDFAVLRNTVPYRPTEFPESKWEKYSEDLFERQEKMARDNAAYVKQLRDSQRQVEAEEKKQEETSDL